MDARPWSCQTRKDRKARDARAFIDRVVVFAWWRCAVPAAASRGVLRPMFGAHPGHERVAGLALWRPSWA